MMDSIREDNREESKPDGGSGENLTESVPPAVMSDGNPSRTHQLSHAAHLKDSKEKPHTKPAIDMRESKLPGNRKQP